MARSIKFTGDANTGQAKFGIYDDVGDYWPAAEPIDESIPVASNGEHTFVVPASSSDYDIDLTIFGTAKKVFVSLSAQATVKLFSVSAPGIPLSGVNVFGGDIQHLFVTTSTAQVTVTVIVGA